jgi:hypothetical protein
VLACRRCFLEFFAWYRSRLGGNPLVAVALADRERREAAGDGAIGGPDLSGRFR